MPRSTKDPTPTWSPAIPCFAAPTGNRKEARAGLPDDNLVTLAKGEGRLGDALHFHK